MNWIYIVLLVVVSLVVGATVLRTPIIGLLKTIPYIKNLIKE